MLDFSWKVFSLTGDIDTYLLLKELERDNGIEKNEQDDQLDSNDSFNATIH